MDLPQGAYRVGEADTVHLFENSVSITVGRPVTGRGIMPMNSSGLGFSRPLPRRLAPNSVCRRFPHRNSFSENRAFSIASGFHLKRRIQGDAGIDG